MPKKTFLKRPTQEVKEEPKKPEKKPGLPQFDYKPKASDTDEADKPARKPPVPKITPPEPKIETKEEEIP